jgi:transposase
MLRVREMTQQEVEKIRRLAHSRTEPLQKVQRARIVWLSKEGWRVPRIAEEVHLCGRTVRRWIKRFNHEGTAGFEDEPRSGRPPTYTPHQVSEVIQTALTDPQTLSVELGLDPPLPFGAWTLDRLAAYLSEHKAIPISRDRIAVLLRREGLKWRMQERWFSEQARLAGKEGKADPLYAQKRGP